MVATTDCVERPKPTAGNKVSKPLMEKKRRARINQCLDELKCLLESYYSSSIRKRKLEKADILELTVKHLRNLQKIQSCAAAASECPDYQIGFHSCLANLNQYLLMADNLNGSERWVLSQLSHKLGRSRRRGGVLSTMDSGLIQARTPEEARRLPPSAAGAEGGDSAKSEALHPRSARTVPSPRAKEAGQASGTKQSCLIPVPAQKADGQSSSHKDPERVGLRNDAGNAQRSVWRPW